LDSENQALIGGDGKYKTPEQLKGMAMVNQLLIFDGRNKNFLDGKAGFAGVPFTPFSLIVIGIIAVFLVLATLGIITGFVETDETFWIILIVGWLFVGVLGFITVNEYRQTQRIRTEGKLLVGQVKSSHIKIRRETKGSGNTRRIEAVAYLIVEGVFKHPQQGTLTKEFEIAVHRSSLAGQQFADGQTDIIIVGTPIAMMYVDESLAELV
jgi:hypothetical protein